MNTPISTSASTAEAMPDVAPDSSPEPEISGPLSKTIAELASYTATEHPCEVVLVADGTETPRTWAYSQNDQWLSVYLGTVISTDPVGPVFTQEALALFARMTVQPPANVKVVINQLIKDLIGRGYWGRLDVLIMPGADVQQSTLNWKANQYNATPVGTVDFIAYKGFLGNGSDFYLDSGFDPIAAMAAGSRFQRDSLSFGGGIQDPNGITLKSRTVMGIYAGTANAAVDILPDGSALNLTAFKIGSAANMVGTVTMAPHHWFASRTSATSVAMYVDGKPILVQANNPSQSWFDDGLGTTIKYCARASYSAGAWTTTRLSNARHAYFIIGGGFTAAEALDMNFLLNAYLAATGSEALLNRTLTPTMVIS